MRPCEAPARSGPCGSSEKVRLQDHPSLTDFQVQASTLVRLPLPGRLLPKTGGRPITGRPPHIHLRGVCEKEKRCSISNCILEGSI